MKAQQGIVLLDNTTIYGAKYAYEAWPPNVNDWFEGPFALNLRSLMDVLEAMVLYDGLMVDSSSRAVYGEQTAYENIWPTLEGLQDMQGNSILHNVPFMEIEKELVVPLVKASLAKLLEHLKGGTFIQSINQFKRDDIDFIVPQFYRSPEDFQELFVRSFSKKTLSDDALEYIELIKSSLKDASSQESNYAMFAFRGFYYLELARLYSISYSPHTWRSNLIDLDTQRPPFDFAKYVTQVTGQIRKELATKLNSEFHTAGFSCEFPVISAYIANQCNSRAELLNVALEIRNSSAVIAFRQWISDIESRIKTESDLPLIVRAKSEVEIILSDIRKQLGLLDNTRKEQVKIKMEIPLASLEVPISIPFGLPNWLEQIFHRRSHLIFLREITKKSVSLSPFAYRYQQLEP